MSGLIMERTIVTGAGGVLGTALLRRLGQQTCEIVALSRADVDLEDAASTVSLFKRVAPAYVFHLAGAVYGVGGNMAFAGDVFRRNVLINTNVIEAARLSGARKIVAMGTTAIYSDEVSQPFREVDCMRGAPHASEYPYAYAKRAMLVQLEAYKAQFGLPFAYAISTNLYGPNDRFDPAFGHVVPSLIAKFDRASKQGTAVDVWGDGSPTRDFLYADDAANGLIATMERGDGTINLASGMAYSIRQLVEAIAVHYPEVAYLWDPTKPLGQLRRSYDVTRLRGMGVMPQVALDEGISRTVAWYRENRGSARH